MEKSFQEVLQEAIDKLTEAQDHLNPENPADHDVHIRISLVHEVLTGMLQKKS